MGLLETILARLDKLESKAGIPASVAPVTPAAPVTPSVPATIVAPAETATAGEVNEHGIPWDARFHAGTRTKNQDGHWKAIKGVDKDALAAYNAQFTAVAAAPATNVTPAVPVAPVAPVAPTAPAVPVAPVVPAVPVAPASPVVQSPDHLAAVKYIQELTTEWKVAYPAVVTHLLAKHGAPDFISCDPSHHATIHADAKAWCEKLALVDAALETLDGVDEATGRTNGLAASASTILAGTGGSPKLGEIAPAKLDELIPVMQKFADDWNNYLEQTTGKRV